eukprot:TRINITY_DN191_c2_g1_i1.p1 TRINITY_DN191_c2_g1~~TRINITY_DN191_c2_g1_i1.p1  ORF type:complete len:839 (+),score=228.39 TRINITY_DN191_c2_g1_i1:694-3210(+)
MSGDVGSTSSYPEQAARTTRRQQRGRRRERQRRRRQWRHCRGGGDHNASFDEEGHMMSGHEGGPSSSSAAGATVHLPPANPDNVVSILEMVAELSSGPTSHRDGLVNAMLKSDYIRKLLDLEGVLEAQGNTQLLEHMFTIFKTLILMNDSNLIEVLFADDYLVDVIGVLEHDSEISPQHRIRHRDFLRKRVIFKEVIPFDSPELIFKIHQTFRLQYLKDVVLPRVLDDSTFGTLNSLIFFNNVEIVTHLQSDTRFLSELFRQLRQCSTPATASATQTSDLLLFLQEMCALAKNLQPPNRAAFYRSIVEQGLFEVFTIQLSDDAASNGADAAVKMSCTDIILATLSHDPSLLRSFITNQRPDHPLLRNLILRFINDDDIGVKNQVVEILKVLIDTEAMDDPTFKDQFLNVFYQDFGLQQLHKPLDRKWSVEELDHVTEGQGFVLNALCELLTYCIKHHTFRIKYFVLGNNTVKKVLKLTRFKDKFLQLSAIRFLRAFVGMKDDFYNRHLVKYKLFSHVIALFQQNGDRYNLINSAIIELFDFIKRENIKILIPHLVSEYQDLFTSIKYVSTFNDLLLQHDKNIDGSSSDFSRSSSTHSASGGGSRGSLGSRGRGPNAGNTSSDSEDADDDDEAYFNGSDDEDDDSSSSSSGSKKGNTVRTSSPSSASYSPSSSSLSPIASPSSLVDYEDEIVDEETEDVPSTSTTSSSSHKRGGSSPPAASSSSDDDEDSFSSPISSSKRSKTSHASPSSSSTSPSSSPSSSPSTPPSPTHSDPSSNLSSSSSPSTTNTTTSQSIQDHIITDDESTTTTSSDNSGSSSSSSPQPSTSQPLPTVTTAANS